MAPEGGPDQESLSQRLGWIAGLVTWFAVLVPSVVGVARSGAVGATEAAFLGSLLLFGALFVVLAGPWDHPRVRRTAHTSLAAAVACATSAALLAPQLGPVPILFILTTAIASHVLSVRRTYALIAFQTLITALASHFGTPDALMTVVQGVAYGGFQIFAATTTAAMLAERTLRVRLSAANAELRATRFLLRETSKLGERGRIARDLHDLVGHHLTALNLQLEVASHLAQGPASAPIERSRAIAKLLLADVRSVVSDLRTNDDLDVERVLNELVDDLPRPRIHLDVAPGVALDDLHRVQVIVRCVQEAITNAIRHGDADNVWVTLRLEGDAIDVCTRDDGVGALTLTTGNGLRGMRERLDEVGGRLDVWSEPGAGFRIHALVPRSGAPHAVATP